MSWLRTQLAEAQRITPVIGHMAAFAKDETRTPAAMSDIRNTTIDAAIRPFAQPGRPPSRLYDFQWHGPMGYNEGGVRVIGAHPRHSRLLYNLSCNRVGFLPSTFGGRQISRLLAGERLPRSIFDPR